MSKRRVFPLMPSTSSDVLGVTAAGNTKGFEFGFMVGPGRAPPPPKSPLHGSRSTTSSIKATANDSSGGGGNASTVAMNGFDRLLVLRQMNNNTTVSGSGGAEPFVGRGGHQEEVSAAQNHKQRKLDEARRRQEVLAMTQEDYTNTEEGKQRLARREELMRMQEEELLMVRLVQAERAQQRLLKQQAEQEEEHRIRAMYLAKLQHEREEKERLAKEKELARKQAMEAKMKALKDAADAQAREAYAARQRQIELEAQLEQEKHLNAMEAALMQLEDALATVMRQDFLAELEREQQIAAEEAQWRLFQEQEEQKQLEATLQRRAAQAQQYEQDKQRRLEIHRLKRERAQIAEQKKLQQHRKEAEWMKTAPKTDAVEPEQVISLHPVFVVDEENIQSTAEDTQANIPIGNRQYEDNSYDCGQNHEEIEDKKLPDAEQFQFEPPQVDVVITTNTSDNIVTEEKVPNEESQTHLQLITEDQARIDGLTPFAQILSATDGSPAAEATLQVSDLLVNFGGITSSTPKCLLAIAEHIQQHINKDIKLIILRPRSQSPEFTIFEVRNVSLKPRKWKGKGLLGCQLAPFKWPEKLNGEQQLDEVSTPATTAADSMTSMSTDEENADKNGQGQEMNVLVFYDVQCDSIADQVGIKNGDLLMRCGDVADMYDITAVATYLQVTRPQSTVEMEIQRWIPEEQSYMHVSVVMPASSDPMGCSLTTFYEYYNATASSATSACLECYYTTLATALHAAALNGHVACLEALFESFSQQDETSQSRAGEVAYKAAFAALDWRDDDGRTPLFYACYAQQVDTVQFLLSKMMQHNQIEPFDLQTGGDLYGDTPLHAATSSGSPEIVCMLLESNYIHVDVVNFARMACPHVAPNVEMLQLLGERFQGDLLATDADGRMALAYACLRNDVPSVEYLCAKHPDFVDYGDAGGNTPLHLAAWFGLIDVIRVLTRYLPSIALHLTNQDGCNALQVAETNGFEEVARYLQDLMNAES